MIGKTMSLKSYKINKQTTEEIIYSLGKINNNCETYTCNELDKMKQFRDKVKLMFKDTPHVLKSKIEDHFVYQNGIKYLIKYLEKDELKNKPVLLADHSKTNTDSKVFDPFEPPFKDGQVIEENFWDLGTHRIFFSKFAIMDEHILLVTRDFESQYTHLTFDDIKNSIILMTAMEGVVIFNGGKKSGASQIRKHLQCIPFSSMYGREFGIFELLKDTKNLLKLDELNSNKSSNYFEFSLLKQFEEYNIKHLLITFSEIIIKSTKGLNNLETISTLIFELYNYSLNYLRLLTDKENILDHYSFLLTQEWLLILPRKSNEVVLKSETLNINTFGYLLTFLIKNKETLKEIDELNIIKDIYSLL